jgi:hypothetical protein
LFYQNWKDPRPKRISRNIVTNLPIYYYYYYYSYTVGPFWACGPSTIYARLGKTVPCGWTKTSPLLVSCAQVAPSLFSSLSEAVSHHTALVVFLLPLIPYSPLLPRRPLPSLLCPWGLRCCSRWRVCGCGGATFSQLLRCPHWSSISSAANCLATP